MDAAFAFVFLARATLPSLLPPVTPPPPRALEPPDRRRRQRHDVTLAAAFA